MKKYVISLFLFIPLLMTACSSTPPPSSSIDASYNTPADISQQCSTQPLKEFSSIEIDVMAANIQVIPGEEWSISYHLSPKEPLQRFGVESDSLYVKTSFDPDEHFNSDENWFITVTIPKESTMTSVQLSTISGNIAKEGLISSVSGDIALSVNHPIAVHASSHGKITLNGEAINESFKTDDGIPVQLKSTSGNILIQTQM